MLLVTTAWCPYTSKGALRSCLILAATPAAGTASSRSSSSMANSSPPEASERVAEAQPARYAFGHPHQELVAGGVAQGVVEALEVVEVHVHHRNPPCLTLSSLSLGPREGVYESVPEEHPVGQASQGVVEGLMGELVLERLTLGEVLQHEPYLQQSPTLVSYGIDERLKPAGPRLVRLRLAEQKRRGHRRVSPTLFDVGGEPHGVQPLVLEDARVLWGITFSQGPQCLPGSIDQKVATIRTKNCGGQRGLLCGCAQV